MASNSHWEIAGKSNKKNKGSSGSGNKKQNKNDANNMPKYNKSYSIKECTTVFTPFIKEEKEKESRAEKVTEKTIDKHTKENNVQTKKQSNQKKKEHKKDKKTLEETISKISEEDIESILTRVKTSFPENPSLWLKELTSYFNLHLNTFNVDPTYPGKQLDYPYCLLNNNIKDLLVETLNHCTHQTRELFFDYCIFTMLTDIGKGQPTHGYQIFIQCIAFNKPEISGKVLNKYLDMIKSSQNRPPQCQAIMWSLGQSGYNDLSWGLKVWLELMFPVIGIRSLAPYSVEYLEKLLNRHKNLTVRNILGVREFFPILDFIFSSNSNISSHLQNRLITLYPKIKMIAFGENSGKVLQHYLPSFLLRLKPNISPTLKEELLNTLVMCLSTNALCYSAWRQMYTKHLTQSSILMQHILDNWDKIYKKIQPKILKETIKSFIVTNEQVAHQNRKDNSHLHCTNCCKNLMLKMGACRFSWLQIVVFLISFICGLIVCDIMVNGNFADSKTLQLLQDSGTLSVSHQIWNKLSVYLIKTTRWCQDNLPHYYNKVSEVCHPYVEIWIQKLYMLGNYIADATKEQRAWIMKKVPEILEWLDEKLPILWNTVSLYTVEIWAYIRHYVIVAWSFFIHYTHLSGIWLQENVFTGNLSMENIQKTLGLFWDNVQNYTLNFYYWVVQAISKS